jgi:hypothetical protein
MARSPSYVLTRSSDKTAHQQIVFVIPEHLSHVCIRLPTFFLVIFSARGSCWHNKRCGGTEKKESVARRCYKHRRDPLPVYPSRCGLLPYGPPSKHPQHGLNAESRRSHSISPNDLGDVTALRFLERTMQVLERFVSYIICLSILTCVDDTLP